MIVVILGIKLIYSDIRFELPIINESSIEMSRYILLSIFSMILVLTRINKLRKLKNQRLNIVIDTKNTKKYGLYVIIVYDVLFLIYVIGLANIYGVVLLVNTVIWTMLVIGWVKLKDGVYDDILMFKGTVFRLDQIENIEQTTIDQNDEGLIELTIVYKFLFLNVLKTLELTTTTKDYEKLMTLTYNANLRSSTELVE